MKDEYIRKAKVTRVVDADTIQVEVDLGFGTWKTERLRLARIDAPEVRGSEREAGLAAKAFVEQILGSLEYIVVKTTKERGKFGRYIAEIEILATADATPVNLSDLLLEEGHAKPYPEK